jgi:hypothetical protein
MTKETPAQSERSAMSLKTETSVRARAAAPFRPGFSHPPGGAERTTKQKVSLHTEFPGALVTGSALEHVGLASPRMHPDQVLLCRVDATAGAG